MELGLITFADMQPESLSGGSANAHQRIKDLLEEIKLADELGLDVFGIGEHHRPDYAVSTPAVVLAAAAAITKNIRLASAVTVLSSDDPVRVYQDFATLDLLSDGRAEIMAGRGSFIESFPLFGYDLNDYNELFTEKLELLLKINASETVSWQGKHTQSINNLGVYPRAKQEALPIWLAAGGTPASAVRAATLGMPLMLAIIGGRPEQFVPFVKLYRDTAAKLGRDISKLQTGINNHVYIGEDSQKAGDEFYPYYAAMMNRVGRDRGWPPLSRQQFDYSRSAEGALMVGSVQQVIDKIMYEHELFGNTRFLAQASVGNVPHKMTMKSIELFGTQVAPVIRKVTSGNIAANK
ncbi:putative LLM family oxidoreductase [Arcticibacter pallidicorallinus]|uniref:Putative LLM family oxidoreductase n=1 Tax=Arcticibacter pallidicorallinus TaxID=1259464 RepID=A0A2T0TYR7_9SPHI|nr:LLM class flavin-dependent oxidoreductase [Arcticibacter pallidicorallinus]PRY50836.1 putative LLM family oxidoreductase [Arcticibacter pallidicorallinus]